MGRALLALASAALILSSCSPLYVLRSAKGHAGLLLRRRSIEKAVKDPKTPPDLRERLALVQEIRSYGFEAMKLSPSKDYATYAPVRGRYLTWLVTAAPRLKLEPHVWRFPLAGAYPYKGHYREEHARREAEALEARGLDAYVRGVSAYNTPLWISDPLPTTALDGPPGELADLLLHELAHGTVYYKGQTEFDEGLASFAGERGAAQFLQERFGKDSAETIQFAKNVEFRRRYDEELASLRERLRALYEGPGAEAEKLAAREKEFAAAAARLETIGARVEKLNNAYVVAHGVYRRDGGAFERAFEQAGRDWPRFWELMRSLDKKRPLEDLQARLARPL